MNSQRVYKVDFSKLPVNICVLTFSSEHTDERDHYPLITRCLNSILENTDPAKYRLHIGCNNLSPRAMAFVDSLVESHHAIKYVGDARLDNQGVTVYPKYPLMHRMYQATSGRIATKEAADWVIWFDDDSHASRNDWLEHLEGHINNTPRVQQFGKMSGILLGPDDIVMAKTFPWYKPAIGIPSALRPGGEIRPGFNFIRGGFYALSRLAIESCSIPDPKIFHNGGDWATTLSLLHHGMQVGPFTYGVNIDAEPRRGMHEDEWAAPDDPALAAKPWITD